MRLVECIPNISEGRDPGVVERVVSAVRATPGVVLLDVKSDADHNRSVVTYLGEPQAVVAATLALCEVAFATLDMRGHKGAHPRMGAVDVVPFVPVRGVTTDEAVALARQVGAWIGARGVPVYYYEDAATAPGRRNLVDVRRGEYEGLAARLDDPAWAPDEGPAVFNPRSGAVAVGARFPLVAFNVNLATDDLRIAERIAHAVRQRDGGFAYVKAMGVALEERGQVQVSMNLTDYSRTPVHRVVEVVRSEAARHGVAVVGCELIGLAPLAVFEESLRHYLQLHEFSLAQIVETRVLEVLG